MSDPLREALALLDDALNVQRTPCDHSGIGKPGCVLCDPRTYRLAMAALRDALASPAPETAEFGGSLASVQAPEALGEACSALAARLERLFALGGPADALSVASIVRHFGEHWTDAIAGQVMALATPTEQPASPDAPIHRHAPDALCVPSWCPVGAAEVARKQERERLAARVEGLTTWPRVCWFAYDAQVRGVPVNPTEDRVVVDRAAVLDLLRETEA